MTIPMVVIIEPPNVAVDAPKCSWNAPFDIRQPGPAFRRQNPLPRRFEATDPRAEPVVGFRHDFYERLRPMRHLGGDT